MKSIELDRHSFRKTLSLIILIILVSLPLFAPAELRASADIKFAKERRDDGLTIVVRETDQDKQAIQYITLILKTGYAHDPAGKYGITNLANEIIYHLLRNTSALHIDFQTYADYSAFQFVTTRAGFNDFCAQLDLIIRLDALLHYDLCNTLIRYHLNQPKPPELVAISQLYSLVYGPGHPYNSIFRPNYDKLDITEINKWFRQIYKPNNLIIASSLKLPDDFLRKPAGRDLKETVNLNEIPVTTGSIIPELKWTPVHDNIATICLGFPASKFGEEGELATILLQKYLDQRLWKVIREDNGLSYDPGVFYLLFSKPSSPMLEVTLHTLAPDVGTVIKLVITEFQKIAAEGIPQEEAAKIMERERKRREQVNKDLESAVAAAALYGLLDQKWLIDREDYLTRLTESTKLVSQVMATGMTKLKIAIAGPEETGQYLNGLIEGLLP